MITTTKPHVDKGYGPTWEGLDNGKIKLEPFKNAKYTSPLYDPMQLDVDEHLRKNNVELFYKVISEKLKNSKNLGHFRVRIVLCIE